MKYVGYYVLGCFALIGFIYCYKEIKKCVMKI